jgi:hypothetical protein
MTHQKETKGTKKKASPPITRIHAKGILMGDLLHKETKGRKKQSGNRQELDYFPAL